MKFNVVAKILLGTFVVAIMTYMGFMLWTSQSVKSNLLCKDVHIRLLDASSKRLITDIEIARMIDAHDLNPLGKSFNKISTDAIEKLLLKNEMIKSVQCYKLMNGTIVVEVLQRTPKFLLAGNQSFYVDTDRKIMPVSLNYAAYVPVVSGRILRSMATGELFDFVDYIEKDTFWTAQIEQIHVRDDQTIELIPRVGSAVIYLGTLDDYQKKLRNLMALYQQGFEKLGWNRYERIDLSYNGQIVCKKTGTPMPVKQLPDSIKIDNDSTVIKRI